MGFARFMDFGKVSYVVHEAQDAYREKSDCVKCQEWSDDELLSADVFKQTEYAVDAYDKF